MDLANLTNFQLYELIHNLKLDKGIRKWANDEFISRKIGIDEIQKLILRHEAQFYPGKDESLRLGYKILLILFPFVIPVQSVFAGRWLAKGHKRKWKEYWFYLSVGYLFWTILVILFAKYYFFKPGME